MKKLFSILLALTLALGMNAAFAESSPYAGGTGTAEDPYQIATAEQLLVLSAAVNDGSVNGYPGTYFVLTEDIDLSGVAWQPIHGGAAVVLRGRRAAFAAVVAEETSGEAPAARLDDHGCAAFAQDFLHARRVGH